MIRHDNRSLGELRKIEIQPGIAPHAQGSVLVSFGNTRVICAAMIEDSVPRWMKEQGVSGGWLTAEYSMLPYSTVSRKTRESTRGKPDGRGTEIQRLIGRSLRAVVDLEKLGSRTLWVDCDVLQADGGTRTAAITGASVAVELACRSLVEQKKLAVLPIKNRVAAVSVGIVKGEVLVDLDYPEDKDAEVDMNVVMTDQLDFVEVQGSGEESVFSHALLDAMLAAAKGGISKLLEIQHRALATP
jgi:ribonuclease PH